jgi:hypothetical protein
MGDGAEEEATNVKYQITKFSVKFWTGVIMIFLTIELYYISALHSSVVGEMGVVLR